MDITTKRNELLKLFTVLLPVVSGYHDEYNIATKKLDKPIEEFSQDILKAQHRAPSWVVVPKREREEEERPHPKM
jgi:hypothetical protein